jgi:hypothetical protein
MQNNQPDGQCLIILGGISDTVVEDVLSRRRFVRGGTG